MMGLYKVPFHDDETTATYCSRLAAANGVRVDPFCLDMGITFASVLAAQDASLETLSGVSGIAIGRLKSNAVRSLKKGQIQIGAEILSAPFFRPVPSRLCTRCIAEDRASNRGHSPAYFRTHWHAPSIRACPVHCIEIIDLGKLKNSDFAFNLHEHALAIHRASSSPLDLRPTSFEKFVLERLRGNGTKNDMLDSIPLQVAVDMCQLVGAYSMKGGFADLRKLTNEEWHRASDIGFVRLREGPAGYKEFLAELSSEVNWPRQKGHGRYIFGEFHEKLRQRGDSPAYQVFRQGMLRFAEDNLPLKSQTMLLGKAISSDRISVKTKRQPVTGSSQNLMAALDHFAGGSECARTVYTIDEIEAASGYLKEKADRAEAARILGLQSGHFGALVSRGHVVADAAIMEFAPTATARYSRSELLRLLMSVEVDEPTPTREGLMPIFKAAIGTSSKFVDIVELLQKKALQSVFFDRERTGFDQIFISMAELKKAQQRPGLIGTRDVAVRLKTNKSYVESLVRNGLLHADVTTIWANRTGFGFTAADIEKFEQHYITIKQLARNHSVAWQRVKPILEKAKVAPLELGHNRVIYHLAPAEAAMKAHVARSKAVPREQCGAQS